MSNIQIGDYVHIISGHCGCSRGYVTFIERWKGNIHGHVHANTLSDSLYINVSVENINYTPIDFEEIKERFK